ncbi:glycosyl transferase family 1 [beta proteobacterium AAP51]|nr:glycosyl transferase family 1 [beta proteobacterium AAP51]
MVPHLVLVTPALASANNGNWQTARRWARLLAPAYRVTLTDHATPAQIEAADAMLALHARRSAASIQAWREVHVTRPLVVVLTGTDLYRDIASDADAQRSLVLADRLVVLNGHGARSLPASLRGKARVVLQSCAARQALTKPLRHLRVLMVGHLRDEKDPQTVWRAIARLRHRADLRFDHVGGPLDPVLGAEARALAAANARFRWLGALPHAATRARIQRAHLLVHASRMEGGAHVVIEALRSGTAVLASAIDGNTGLLGDDHPGLFTPGDDAALATLLERCRDEPAILPALSAAGDRRAPLFKPEAEAAALKALLAELLPPGA